MTSKRRDRERATIYRILNRTGPTDFHRFHALLYLVQIKLASVGRPTNLKFRALAGAPHSPENAQVFFQMSQVDESIWVSPTSHTGRSRITKKVDPATEYTSIPADDSVIDQAVQEVEDCSDSTLIRLCHDSLEYKRTRSGEFINFGGD